MATISPLISIIVPVLPDEVALEDFLMQFESFAAPHEIIVSATVPIESFKLNAALQSKIRWVQGEKGRAKQLNRGTAQAKGEFLWFLHADSTFKCDVLDALPEALEKNPNALHYFRLAFGNERLALTKLNAVGANLRARWLKMPFGDQGLCIKRSLFFELKSFDESAPYGEDHLLVWAARHRRIPILGVPGTIATSPRKYQRRGWLRTTLNHFVLTYKQAAPEFAKLVKDRVLKS